LACLLGLDENVPGACSCHVVFLWMC
jgi:hypothetical protein